MIELFPNVSFYMKLSDEDARKMKQDLDDAKISYSHWNVGENPKGVMAVCGMEDEMTMTAVETQVGKKPKVALVTIPGRCRFFSLDYTMVWSVLFVDGVD